MLQIFPAGCDAFCLAQATYKDYATKLYATPNVTSAGRFSKPKLDQTGFTIDHYAGEV